MPRIRHVDRTGTAQVIQIARSGTRVARELSLMPLMRDICLEVHPRLTSDPRGDRPSYNEASMGYIVGRIAAQKCTRCARSGGRLAECVVVEKPDGEKYFGGGCTNCRHRDHPEDCSFHGAVANQGGGDDNNSDDEEDDNENNDEEGSDEHGDTEGQRERNVEQVEEREVGDEEESPAPEQVDDDNSGDYHGTPAPRRRRANAYPRQYVGGKLSWQGQFGREEWSPGRGNRG